MFRWTVRRALGPLACALFVIALSRPLWSAVILYTDEAAFIAAAGLHHVESFEDVGTVPAAYGDSAAFGRLLFQSPPSSQIDVVALGTYGAHNTTPAGNQFLQATGASAFHDPMRISHTGGPMLAWGANFTDLDFGTIEFFVDGGMEYSPLPGLDGNTMFVGFIGDVPFSQIMLTIDDRTYGIDDVRARVVPEPAAFAMAVLGVLGLVIWGRAASLRTRGFHAPLAQVLPDGAASG